MILFEKMSCIKCCIFKCLQLFITYGYPGYKVIKTAQQKDYQKLWIIYFFIIGLCSICEETILFPLIFALGKLSCKIYPTLKTAFLFWLYYPEYRGALLIEQKTGDLIDKVFLRINPLVGKIFSFLGYENRDIDALKKKNE